MDCLSITKVINMDIELTSNQRYSRLELISATNTCVNVYIRVALKSKCYTFFAFVTGRDKIYDKVDI